MKTRILWVLRRLSLMSPGEIAYRSRRTVRQRIQRRRLEKSRSGSVPPGEPSSVAWLVDLGDREKISCVARDRFGWTERYASDLMDHRFSFFAFDRKPFGPVISWNRDYSTGREAPLDYGPTLDYRNEHRVGDVKYAWEHNRHHHLVELAKAYYLSGHERYAGEVRDQIEQWIDACPYPLGINWASALESAIRVINWCFCLHFLRSGGPWLSQQEAFLRKWSGAVYNHLQFIKGNFSRYSSANNHLIGEASGLFIGSLCFRFPGSEAWARAAAAILQEESVRQHWPDGVLKEQAVAYQAFVFDFLLLPALLGERNGIRFPDAYWGVLERSAEFIGALIDGNGDVPQIGDDDDGRVIILARPEGFRPFRSLLVTAAALFDRADFREKAHGFDEKAFWLLGSDGQERFDRASRRPAPRRQFPDGGYFILQLEDARTVVDCGPLGYLSLAAHGHADALSVLLEYKGKPFFVDPGTYAYHTKKEWRDYFRGTGAHNSVRVDGENQSVIGGNFMWLRKARCRLLSADDHHVRGSHDGFARLTDPVVHEREVRLFPEKHAIAIRDKIICSGSHRVEQFFHLHPACTCTEVQDGFIISQGGVEIHLVTPERWEKAILRGSMEPIAGWYSPGYDRKLPSATLRTSGMIDGLTEWVTLVNLHSP